MAEEETKTQEQIEREASAEAAGLPPTPPDPRVVAERYRQEQADKERIERQLREYENLSAREQYETLEEARDTGIIKEGEPGYIPEGSQYVAGITVGEGLSQEDIARIERQTGVPAGGWGYYSPQQLQQREEAYEQARLANEQIKLQSEAERQAFEQSNTQLPDGQWIENTQLEAVRSQSPYGYEVLTGQGFSSYERAIQNALQELEPYKVGDGYRLKPAVAGGVSNETLSLLFRPEDVAEAEKVRYIPEEEQIEAKIEEKVSALPVIAAIPTMSAVAVAEPTPIGEVVVGLTIAGALIYTAIMGDKIDWDGLWSDIKNNFKKETGREPTAVEQKQLEVFTASTLNTVGVNVANMPFELSQEKLYVPGTIAPTQPIYKAGELQPPSKIYEAGELREPSKIYEAGELLQPTKIYEAGELQPPTKLVGIATQTAVAEEELNKIWTIIRPKIVETGKYLPMQVPKTETALVALDEAVKDAFTSGEIDSDTLRVYSQARDDYLTKKGLLDSSLKSYIGGVQPTIQYLSKLILISVLAQLQNVANQVALESYNQALNQDMTKTQAQANAFNDAQNAVQTNTLTAVQTATQTITDTATRTAVSNAVRSAVRANTRALARTATNTATTTMTGARALVAPIVPFYIPPIAGGAGGNTVAIPSGSYAWKQGLYWKYIPPPYNQRKPINLPKGVVPEGARKLNGRTPAETIQIIGVATNVPDRVDVDMGVVDAFITPENGGKIVFSGSGQYTNVGSRIDSTTMGMDLGEGDYPGVPVATSKAKRLSYKKRPKRVKRQTDEEYYRDLLEVRGEV